MTAEVVGMSPRGRPSGAQQDETIRRTIRALMKGRGLNVETLAPEVGMSTGTLYRRLATKGPGRPFQASEVADLANYFGVTVADLYDGLGGTFSPPPDDGTPAPTPRPTRTNEQLDRLTKTKQARARGATRSYQDAA